MNAPPLSNCSPGTFTDNFYLTSPTPCQASVVAFAICTSLLLLVRVVFNAMQTILILRMRAARKQSPTHDVRLASERIPLAVLLEYLMSINMVCVQALNITGVANGVDQTSSVLFSTSISLHAISAYLFYRKLYNTHKRNFTIVTEFTDVRACVALSLLCHFATIPVSLAYLAHVNHLFSILLFMYAAGSFFFNIALARLSQRTIAMVRTPQAVPSATLDNRLARKLDQVARKVAVSQYYFTAMSIVITLFCIFTGLGIIPVTWYVSLLTMSIWTMEAFIPVFLFWRRGKPTVSTSLTAQASSSPAAKARNTQDETKNIAQ